MYVWLVVDAYVHVCIIVLLRSTTQRLRNLPKWFALRLPGLFPRQLATELQTRRLWMGNNPIARISVATTAAAPEPLEANNEAARGDPLLADRKDHACREVPHQGL